jgi:phenylalanyl-tRNA synthetase beta chain
VAENYGISDRVYLGELDLDLLLRETNIEIKYKALPRYPAVTRDLALVIKKEITAGQVLDKIKSAGGKILEEVSLFDIYEGKQVADGYKSLAYSLTYRASDRTLKDQEVNQVHSKIVAALESDLGAHLR